MKRFIKYTLVFYLLVIAAYWIFIQPVFMNWGATAAEISGSFPGNESISPHRVVSVRAIDIRATKEKVWPWIAQTGQNRGGFNSYHWLENLFGAKMSNAGSVHPEWQNPRPGDTVYYGENQGYELVSRIKPYEYYSLGGWLFYLQSPDSINTRLIIRYPSMEVRERRFATIYYYGLFEPLHFIMESGMMMGIKQKAEQH
jgi:hypothetical protein